VDSAIHVMLERSCTRSLRLIPFPRKPGTMPPGLRHVKGVRHDSTPIFLPDGRLGTPVAIFPVAYTYCISC
jgi:hypothetical protein